MSSLPFVRFDLAALLGLLLLSGCATPVSLPPVMGMPDYGGGMDMGGMDMGGMDW